MKKFTVIETEHVVRTWAVEAENETEARIIYDTEGVLSREKTLSSDIDVEEY